MDNTNPSYYRELDPEPISVITNWGLDFHLGSVIKYIARAGYKEGSTELVDLRKAEWYLRRKIQMLEREEEEANAKSAPPEPPEPSLLDRMPKWVQDLAHMST